MPKRARDVLFGGEQDNLRRIAEALNDSRIYQNFSNTAGASNLNQLLRQLPAIAGKNVGLGFAGFGGGLPATALYGIGSNLTARALTSPTMINALGWMGKSGAGKIPGALGAAGKKSAQPLNWVRMLESMQDENK